MSLSIRTMQAPDIPHVAALFDLYRQFYEQAPDHALAQRYLTERFDRKESVVLVARASDPGLLGFCQLYPGFCSVEAGPIYTLYDLFVRPDARRLGVGRALLQAAAVQAAADGKLRMDLSTARDNVKAQALYESLGWVRDTVFLTYSLRTDSPATQRMP